MIGTVQRLRSDCRGAAIVEMALVFPVLAALLVGVVDLSRGYSEKLQLEQAAQRSIEKAMQGAKNLTMYNSLKAEAASAAGVPLTDVTVDYWLECNGTRQATYEVNCPAGQTYARYLSVQILKKYTPLFKTRFLGSNGDGTFTLKGFAGMRVQ